MADPAVRLPEPSADDDGDVVWGISTAKTLWARGERRDAIVWIRRAADAARTAGQGFRATELTMYASEIEDELEVWLASPQGQAATAAASVTDGAAEATLAEATDQHDATRSPLAAQPAQPAPHAVPSS